MMNLLSLPDEMCASVFKYCSPNAISKCRRMSKGIDNVVKKYILNRIIIFSLKINLSKLFCSEQVLHKKRAEAERRLQSETSTVQKYRWQNIIKKNSLKPLTDGIQYKICRVELLLFNPNNKSSFDCHMFERFTEESDKYNALGRILQKLNCTYSLEIRNGKYDAKLDTCLLRNRKTFKNASSVRMDGMNVTCSTDEFRYLKRLSQVNRLNTLVVRTLQENCNFSLEKALSDYGGALEIEKYKVEREPDNFGDELLQKWIAKVPHSCGLRGYKNNFTFPTLKNFLLSLLQSTLKYRKYNLGVLSNQSSTVDVLRFLNGHIDLRFEQKEDDEKITFEIWIIEKHSCIEFSIEK